MKILLDTHLLLWGAHEPERLPPAARSYMHDPDNELLFSAASIWEVAIKVGRRYPDFIVEPGVLRRGLVDNGYAELVISSDHAIAVAGLPPIHKDPFDRLLIAQATAEGIPLLSDDELIAKYPGPIWPV